MTGRPRLLFLGHTLPYPPDGGPWIRSYHVLRLLARVFDITALCFERAASARARAPLDAAIGREALGRFAGVEVFPIPQRRSRARYAWDHLRSTARRRVYTEYVYDSTAFRRRLTELRRSRAFDLAHVDSLVDLAGYLPAVDGVPAVCVHHDVESALLRRRADIETRPWRRAYLRYQAQLMEDVERRWCERVALNVAVSERDRDALLHIAPGSRVALVPNGVDVEEFRPDGTEGAGVTFVGGTHWLPNLDALEFFCARILPRLRTARPDLPVSWIGSASAVQQRRYRERAGVRLTGYVEDVRPFMREAACHIVPLRVGGGTRLKILNSWALGKAVVSTSVGCEGLEARDGENILVRNDPDAFADAVLAVLEDGELRRRLGAQGRATAERLYSWEVIGRGMVETYLLIAAPHRRDLAPVAQGAS